MEANRITIIARKRRFFFFFWHFGHRDSSFNSSFFFFVNSSCLNSSWFQASHSLFSLHVSSRLKIMFFETPCTFRRLSFMLSSLQSYTYFLEKVLSLFFQIVSETGLVSLRLMFEGNMQLWQSGRQELPILCLSTTSTISENCQIYLEILAVALLRLRIVLRLKFDMQSTTCTLISPITT